MKRIISILAMLCVLPLLFSCGETKEAICSICGSPEHTSSVCIYNSQSCLFCGELTHTVENCPKICDECSSMNHLCHKCYSSEHKTYQHVYCDICCSSEHNTNEHPYCEIENCDRHVHHTTSEHPVCNTCERQHYPFCEGSGTLYCEICGKNHSTADHITYECDICGNDHETEYHPICTACEGQHKEAPMDCPNYCNICGATKDEVGHNTAGHKCGTCGSPKHATENCDQNKAPAPKPETKPEPKSEPESKSETTQESAPAPAPKNDKYCHNCGYNPSHETKDCTKACSLCGESDHKADDHCIVCGSIEHITHPAPKNDKYCHNCGYNSSHETKDCAKACSSCGKLDHKADDHCNEAECTQNGSYHTGSHTYMCSYCAENHRTADCNKICNDSNCTQNGTYHDGGHTYNCEYCGGNHKAISCDTCTSCGNGVPLHVESEHCYQPNCIYSGTYHTDAHICRDCGFPLGFHNADCPMAFPDAPNNGNADGNYFDEITGV